MIDDDMVKILLPLIKDYFKLGAIQYPEKFYELADKWSDILLNYLEKKGRPV